MKKILSIVMLVSVFFTVHGAPQVSSSSLNKAVVRVGYVGSPPFVSSHKPTSDGFAIDLWVFIADHLGFNNYTMIDAGQNYNHALQELSEGQYDILIGNISVSSQRERLVDFSVPFLLNKTSLVVPDSAATGAGFLTVLMRLIFSQFGLLFLGIFVMIGVIAVAYGYSQSKIYAAKGQSITDQIQTSLWVTSLALLLGDMSYDPENKRGRLILVLACALGIIFLSLIGAACTTSLLRSQQAIDEHYTIHKLKNKKIIVEKGSIQVTYMRDIGAVPVEVDHIDQGFELLKEKPNEYVGFALDNGLAQYYLSRNADADLKIAPTFLGADLFAFAFPHGSPFKETVNGGVLYAAEESATEHLCQSYISDTVSECKLLSL